MRMAICIGSPDGVLRVRGGMKLDGTSYRNEEGASVDFAHQRSCGRPTDRGMRAPRLHDRLRGTSGATPCRAASGDGGTIPPSSALLAGSGRRSNHRPSSRSALLYISAGTNAWFARDIIALGVE